MSKHHRKGWLNACQGMLAVLFVLWMAPIFVRQVVHAVSDDEGGAAAEGTRPPKRRARATQPEHRDDEAGAAAAAAEWHEDMWLHPTEETLQRAEMHTRAQLHDAIAASRPDQRLVYANAMRDSSFKGLLEEPEVLKKLLELFVPDLEGGIDEVEPMPTAIPPHVDGTGKQVFMDVHVKDGAGHHDVVEVQVRRHRMFDERAFFYAAWTYAHQLDNKVVKGAGGKVRAGGEAVVNPFALRDWYTHLRRVVAIQILDYDSGNLKGFKDGQDELFERNTTHPMEDGQSIKHFCMTDAQSGQTLPFFHMIQIELPRADRLLNLQPLDPAGERRFTEQEWFLSILKHASDYTEERVATLEAKKMLPPFVKTMLRRLSDRQWTKTRLATYLSEEEWHTHFEQCYAAYDVEKARAAEQKGAIRAQLQAIERLVEAGFSVERAATTLQCDTPGVLREQLAEVEAGTTDEARHHRISESGAGSFGTKSAATQATAEP